MSTYPGRSRIQRRHSNALPIHTHGSFAVQEKLARHPHHISWWLRLSLPIPFIRTRRLRLFILNPRRVHVYATTRFGRTRGCSLLVLLVVLVVFIIIAINKAGVARNSTLVFGREDLQSIWIWEVRSGHYPSRSSIPEQLRLKEVIDNPALPPRKIKIPIPSQLKTSSEYMTGTHAVGPERVYLNVQDQHQDVAYPPRPIPGSVADLDVVMEHCDFSKKKYVRDCLEVLRVGAGLDNGKRMRRGTLNDWKYIYVERQENSTSNGRYVEEEQVYLPVFQQGQQEESNFNAGLHKRRGVDWEKSPIKLRPPVEYKPYVSLPTPCDPESPRLFHMFWTGPFTDKPYLAILSFLFTQNTGLHVKHWDENTACRPKFWLWINPGPAASVPNPNAVTDMINKLKSNPWASPFLHPRFKDVIEFKLWNTTDQLDSIEELKDEWRSRDLFNSGGNVIKVNKKNNGDKEDKSSGDDMLNRTGSKSASTYDRLSVILSDMARFILCHRYGGIYLDADTIFLRDWEELWGWKGAFAYRWSRMTRYNTAVLKLNKRSALGKFLFRTALKNNMDFHPMTVSEYTKEAYLENLLLRLPDALFDSAWLNTENYQVDRPPQPFFTKFEHFFDTPVVESAAPQVLGFEGFFRGAFSYHFHNFWWKPFDPARNWPDLGPKFKDGERIARAALSLDQPGNTSKFTMPVDEDEDSVREKRDLDWATVLKRIFESYIRGERPNMYGEWLEW